ncbi:hypothetical protein M413DRAFT_31323 [Hebeloma cylindrosporum]|uniref:Uncharacterized protein n=1 Tax=Hebeloma cylindrosporum TaxID=76867 RepID=A0A0C3BXZ7_HEBCY|nr:hypothetical protein M413DRAFT_31323 [Hebeloma cylindrosporum h7]
MSILRRSLDPSDHSTWNPSLKLDPQHLMSPIHVVLPIPCCVAAAALIPHSAIPATASSETISHALAIEMTRRLNPVSSPRMPPSIRIPGVFDTLISQYPAENDSHYTPIK